MSFWNRKREEKVEKYKEIPFQHLAPIDSVKDKAVFEALDYALSQNNVHNIALTGNYGSGKSSVLESYIKRNRKCTLIEWILKQISKMPLFNRLTEKKKWFLKISLATFAIENDDSSNSPNDVIPTTTEQEIEKSILQQIFYRKSGKKFPYSRFSRIKKIGLFRKIITEIIVLLLLFVPIYMANEKLWNIIKAPFSKDGVDFFLGAIFVIAFLVALYKTISLAYKIRLAKLSFQDAEIEFEGKNNEESLLNKYLDELLYFFEVTEYNVVVIEDLDRFKNTEIFIKLRELNTLLNNYEKINRKIVFVYALRDEVFKDSSRTKFFDFIIPVIPVINNQNSSDILLNLRSGNLESPLKELDEDFLQDIGLYVDDMRLLINSINEFKIYDKKINESDYIENKETKVSRDRNKIFALILYKNLYPNDFALLAQNKGELHSIFEKKKDVAEKQKAKIEQEIAELEVEITKVESQIEVDIQELRTIYIAKVFSKKPKNNTYIANDVSDFLSDEAFQKIQLGNSLSCVVPGYSGISRSNFKYDFFAIEKEVNPLYSYKEREERLKKKLNGEIETFKRQVAEKRTLLSNIQQMSMEEMLDEFSPEQFVTDVKLINKEFIIYLLRFGYIDENYFEYISYFYANSLSEQEKQYLLLIKNRQEPNFDLLINNANFGKVVARIKDTEWKLPAVLNYSILYCIITFDDLHIDLFLRALWKYKLFNRNTLFLSKFNASPYIQSKLYRMLYDLFRSENNWLDKLFGDENPNVAYNFFIYVQFEKTENDIITFLTDDITYLHRIDIDKDAVASNIKYYDLKFNLLEDTAKYPVYDILLDNAAYIVSKKNIDIIIKHANGDVTEESIKDYYTQISKLKNQNIKAYVDQNIEVFVNDIVLSTGDSMAESEGAFIELLNEENLMTETKAKLIEKNNCVVSDITQIKGAEIQLTDGENKAIDIRNLLYKCKKISPTWLNIYENFKYNGNKLDPCLVDYLNDDKIVEELTNEKPLTSEELKDENGNYDIAKEVYHEVLCSKAISLDEFSKLMDVCPWNYQNLGNYDIDFEKMGVLINLRKLSLTSENYLGIKQKHPSLLSKFISNNFDEFINKKDELKNNISIDDIKMFLDSSKLNDTQKIRLLSTDFEVLLSVNQKDLFIWFGKKIIELEFTGKTIIPIKPLFRNLDEEADVINMITLQAENLDEADIVNAINNKTNNDCKSIIKREGRKVKIPNTVQNKKLCAKLKEKGLISSYQDDGDKIGIYQKKS